MTVILLVLCVVLIIVLTARYGLHPFLSLLLASLLFAFFSGMNLETLVTSFNDGFGGTLGKIGLIIVFGVIIGSFLEHTGAAYTLAESILTLIGRKRVAQAMSIIGYFISIPVFADSGFLLVAPLNKSISRTAGVSLAGTAVALGLGLTATHTMVPPTPGPVAAAGLLGADVGLVMLLGLPVSAFALIPGIIFAVRYAARTEVTVEPEEPAETLADDRSRPGILKASLPVVVPILLIVIRSLLANIEFPVNQELRSVVFFLGEPAIALLVGVFLSFSLPPKLNASMISSDGWVGSALRSAASILLITGAGGIFGKVLQNSGIAQSMGDMLAGLNAGILLPFILAAAIKTAQGSSTVALITAASILSPMMDGLGFDTDIEKALVVLSIGAGSIVVSHANDSFFWVVTQMTGLNVRQGYRLYTTGTLVLGLGAAITIFFAHLILA